MWFIADRMVLGRWQTEKVRMQGTYVAFELAYFAFACCVGTWCIVGQGIKELKVGVVGIAVAYVRNGWQRS